MSLRDAILALKLDNQSARMITHQKAWLLLLSAIVGCSGSDPAKQVDGAQSWTATSILIGERWLARSVPDAYANSALRNAADELEKTANKLSESLTDSTQAKRDSLILPLKMASLHARQMAREVATKNSPAFSIQLDSLRTAGRLLESAAPKQTP